ncbi:MAG: LysM peptidoglycan-binding domain-containing protein [Puniceicoccales bacterium]|nr:LysM peptidoglycan-binding domain-containing protein [Puniceicoccales bacterium]
MSALFFKSLRPALLAGMLFLSPPLFGQSAEKLAGMEQDVSAMREEIRALREEVQDLRAAVQKANAQAGNPAAATASLQQQVDAHGTTLQAQGAAIRTQDAETKRRLTEMAAATNKALADLAKKVDAALQGHSGGHTSTATATTPKEPVAPPPAPTGMPQTGFVYKVKAGDSVIKIARTQGSRKEWILAANNLTEKTADSIRPGQELFIPRKTQPKAETPSPVPQPSPPPSPAAGA